LDSKAGPAGLAKSKEVGKEAGGALFNKSVSTALPRMKTSLRTLWKTSRI
jgi:hypothetical protein